MALRVKNVAAGFYDATGFHPIRSSADYDPDRKGWDGEPVDEYRTPRKRKSRKARKSAKPKHKPRAKPKSRKKNPISAKWVKAQVRRVGKDIQVMLFPKRRPARRRRR